MTKSFSKQELDTLDRGWDLVTPKCSNPDTNTVDVGWDNPSAYAFGQHIITVQQRPGRRISTFGGRSRMPKADPITVNPVAYVQPFPLATN